MRNERVAWIERIALIYTTPGVKRTASGQLPNSTGSSARGSVMAYRGGMGERREVQEEEEIYIHIHTHITGSLYCTAETNTAL